MKDLALTFEVLSESDLAFNVVETLDYALGRRRLVSFSGIMKEWHKKLNLDDVEDGDLIHIEIDKDSELENEQIKIETYAWNVGFMNYIKI